MTDLTGRRKYSDLKSWNPKVVNEVMSASPLPGGALSMDRM